LVGILLPRKELRMRDISREIEQFADSIEDLWKDEPLDGNETEEIARKVLSELNRRNGNN
jgi:hypothetical protein